MKRANRFSIKATFHLIQVLIVLLLVVLLVQGAVLWSFCQRGQEATQGLEKEGLPSLRLLASLQENLAIYRLHSYELMFVQDKDRPAKLSETAFIPRSFATPTQPADGGKFHWRAISKISSQSPPQVTGHN